MTREEWKMIAMMTCSVVCIASPLLTPFNVLNIAQTLEFVAVGLLLTAVVFV